MRKAKGEEVPFGKAWLKFENSILIPLIRQRAINIASMTSIRVLDFDKVKLWICGEMIFCVRSLEVISILFYRTIIMFQTGIIGLFKSKSTQLISKRQKP